MFSKLINTFLVLTIFLISPFAFSQTKVIKIGASLPLSGGLAQIGEDIKRGFLLAKEDLDSEQVKFDFVFEDDGFQGKNAATTALKLLDVDKVDIIISLWDMAEVIAPAAERHKVPHISIRWNPHVAEKFNYTMTFEATYISYANSMLELLKAQQIKSVYIVKQEIESWNLVYSYMKDKFQDYGIKVLGESSLLATETEHNSILFKAIKGKPDQILFFTMPETLGVFMNKLKLLFPGQKLGGALDDFGSNDLELIINQPYVSLENFDKTFNNKFKAKFGNEVISRAAHAYDLSTLIKDYALSTSADKTLNKEGLIEYLNRVKNYKGVSGTLNSNGKRTIEGDCLWKVVKNVKGEFKVLDYRP